LDASGRPRQHWRRLAASLRRLGAQEFSRRWDLGQRLIQANGVTYNVYGDPRGTARPWPMDLVPLALDGDEWTRIERAVVQRATLLNAVLADLYGSHRLVRDGQIPPEVLFANPSFLRPCHGIVPPSGVFLHNYAADLARAPNGDWWVIADRTQAPSGAGYALENRLVSTRTLPLVLDRCRVEPLHDFFEATINALLALAPHRTPNPRVVVMTSGPDSETYFEHSFVARQWDFPLVGGDDLTVRDGRVYLKTLAGLNPVDVILRRLDDDYCDPLELRGDSLLGVPGLVQAARAGNVCIANALGSGLVESPALMAFLPALSRHLLGEDLRLPSVATWWCGQESARRQVLDRLEHVVIKPAFPRFGQHAEFPATMTEAARKDLAARIEARPEEFVAQEQVDLSTTPVHTHRGLEARHVVLRIIAAWNGSSYSVLPGGLARVATGQKSLVVSMQRGGGSKDTWVLGRPHARQRDVRPVAPRTSYVTSTELSSRMADNLFWLGRYAERLEASARLTRVLLTGLSGESDLRRDDAVETAVHYLRGLDLMPAEFRNATVRQWWSLQRLLTDMTLDAKGAATIGWNVGQVRRLSWEVKERLSPDTWRVLQQIAGLFAEIAPTNHDRRVVAALAKLDDIVIMLSAFAGLQAENPTRGHGWRFLAIGRRVERALQMLELLRVGVATAPFPDDPYLEVLLQVADSSTTYRSRYLTSIRTRYVLELLLTDDANPRSVAYQVASVAEHIQGLPRHERDTATDPQVEYALAVNLLKRVQEPSVDDLKRRDVHTKRPALEAHLRFVKAGVSEVSSALAARYLSHSVPSRLRSV
jgi:uncharacterized circularly permuted ATP-grasp superfamily protein/uncharacterized alpha-E superfamily protein